MQALEIYSQGQDAGRVRVHAQSLAVRLPEVYLAGCVSPKTRAKYRANLEALARLAGVPAWADADELLPADVLAGRRSLRVSDACHAEVRRHRQRAVDQVGEALLAMDRPTAWLWVRGLRQRAVDAGLRPGQTADILGAVWGLVATANTLGLVEWTLPKEERRGLRVGGYRDTRGPGMDGFRRMLAQVDDTPKGKRDAAILWLLGPGRALRRFEVVGLDVEHVDVAGRRLCVLGKKRQGREWLTIGAQAMDAVARWIEARGDHAGPLFSSLDRARKGSGRLSEVAVWQIVQGLGYLAGLGAVRPHGLRHMAATELLRDGVPLVQVQRFCRHADPKTTLVYLDALEDWGGDAAARLCAKV